MPPLFLKCCRARQRKFAKFSESFSMPERALFPWASVLLQQGCFTAKRASQRQSCSFWSPWLGHWVRSSFFSGVFGTFLPSRKDRSYPRCRRWRSLEFGVWSLGFGVWSSGCLTPLRRYADTPTRRHATSGVRGLEFEVRVLDPITPETPGLRNSCAVPFPLRG